MLTFFGGVHCLGVFFLSVCYPNGTFLYTDSIIGLECCSPFVNITGLSFPPPFPPESFPAGGGKKGQS